MKLGIVIKDRDKDEFKNEENEIINSSRPRKRL